MKHNKVSSVKVAEIGCEESVEKDKYGEKENFVGKEKSVGKKKSLKRKPSGSEEPASSKKARVEMSELAWKAKLKKQNFLWGNVFDTAILDNSGMRQLLNSATSKSRLISLLLESKGL